MGPATHAALRLSAATRPGRGHRQRGEPCQDAAALWRDPRAPRAAAAVADGLGSKPRSQHGSRAACDAAVASLAAEPGAWDEAALRRAFAAARDAVAARAAELGLEPRDLATTLQVATLDGERALAAMVGDGAAVACRTRSADEDGMGRSADDSAEASEGHGVHVLAAPPPGRYANEVVPLTDAEWEKELQVAELPGARIVLLFSDGLTRLLLAKQPGGGWAPFAPFFDAFLPRLVTPRFDERLAQAFLDGDEVDRSWDDDKALAILAHDPSFAEGARDA